MSLWEAYRQTIFICHQDVAAELDFAIISAQNPWGKLTNPLLNQCLDKQFEHVLQQRRLLCRKVTGAAPDFSVQEKSWIVICDKAQATQLAEQCQQLAMYWVEQGQLYLVPVLAQQQECAMGSFVARRLLMP